MERAVDPSSLPVQPDVWRIYDAKHDYIDPKETLPGIVIG